MELVLLCGIRHAQFTVVLACSQLNGRYNTFIQRRAGDIVRHLDAKNEQRLLGAEFLRCMALHLLLHLQRREGSIKSRLADGEPNSTLHA